MTYTKQRVIDAAQDLLELESVAAFVLPLPEGGVVCAGEPSAIMELLKEVR